METKVVNAASATAVKKQYEKPEIEQLILKNEGIVCSSSCCDGTTIE